jgi:anti-sigma B factor antagonist
MREPNGEEVPVTSLQVSAAASGIGQVVVLAGEADLTTITQLAEVLDAQLTGQVTHLTIDVSGLRFADVSSIRILAVAAVTLINRGGSLVLVHPQPSVARMLTLLCLEDMFTIRSGTGTAHSEPRPRTSR